MIPDPPQSFLIPRNPERGEEGMNELYEKIKNLLMTIKDKTFPFGSMSGASPDFWITFQGQEYKISIRKFYPDGTP